jgi:hypothetical protein
MDVLQFEAAVREAALRQELPRAVQVAARHALDRHVARDLLREGAGHQAGRAVVDLHQGVVVEGVCDGLADVDVRGRAPASCSW